MLRIKMNMRLVVCVVSIVSSTLCAMNGTGLGNIFFRPEFHWDKTFQLAAWAERGVRTQAFDDNGCTNVLRIWNAEQDALKMVQGFPATSAIGLLSTKLNAADDGVRGHFLVDGCLELVYNLSFAARYQFCQDFLLSAYLPVRSMRLNNVAWCNQTLDVTDQDERVRDYLTNDFFANVEELGCLNLQGWKRSGFGDLMLLIEWMRDFPQSKPLLKNVRLDAWFGLTIPTGLKQDEDRIFAVPFGYDGAFGLPFGVGLDLTLGCYVKAGVDVELLHLFGNTKLRRIKTDKDQTELLLLQKVCAFKDWGLTQQFTLYVQFYNFYKGFSLKTGYQYLKHGDDRLSFDNLDFSPTIANSALYLEHWTAHTVLATLNYDWGYDDKCDARVKPQLALFARVPFNGRQSALFTTIGTILAIDF